MEGMVILNRKIFSLLVVFALFMATLSGVVGAEEVNEPDEKEVKELAGQLEFVYEEALIFDEEGTFIGFDLEKIEEKYGSTLGLEQVSVGNELNSEQLGEPTIGIQSAAVDRCILNKIKSTYGDVFEVSTYTTIIDYITAGKYTSAAKKILSVGVRGNAVVIAGTLTAYFFSCLATAGDNPWN